MQKTKIEWVRNPDGTQGMSWNPIKGLCPVNCWYCYAKPLYARFKQEIEGIEDGASYLAEWELEQPIKREKPTGIFVCSTFELFHPSVRFARDEIFKTIEQCPQHRFYILTKFPQNIDRPLPENCWIGVTITKNEDIWRVYELMTNTNPKTIKFVSFEPLLEEILFFTKYESLDWMIIGRLTGFGNRCKPEKLWIKNMIKEARILFTPVFLKNNLKRIWGEPLIQEIPNG